MAFPGDEGEHYFQNPGESFAESFMHLNEVKLGLPETPWGYDPMFTPDAVALAAIEQDVPQAVEEGPDQVPGEAALPAAASTRRSTSRPRSTACSPRELHGPRGSTLTVSGPCGGQALLGGLSAGLVCGQRTVTARFTAGGAGSVTRRRPIPP